MLFNSLAFLIFAACFFLFWPLARRNSQARWVYITLGSFLFYGWWDYRFLFLILANGLLNFYLSLAMKRRPRWKPALLVLSFAGGLGALAVFKYSEFIAANVDEVLGWWGLNFRLGGHLPEFMRILQVGISFYTFQSMSYTVDVYRGELEPTRNAFHFLAYLSFFPQLVAGPIVRAVDLLPQLAEDRRSSPEQRWEGLRFMVHGYFKKVVIADNFAPIVDRAFSQIVGGEGSGIYWWWIVTLFAVQIYCDFSGYSDIAIGLCKWCGYELMTNFDHPYTSASLREFWQRWHISLSTWFRDYVYIPLGGSRDLTAKVYRNLWATILLSALWHGAAWHFVAWGAFHAMFLSIERATRWPQRLAKFPGGALLAILSCLFQVWIAWVFFRAENIGQAVQIAARMLSDFEWQFPLTRFDALLLLIVFCREASVKAALGLQHFVRNPKLRALLESLSLALMIVACVYLRGRGHAFIYFQF